jgi:hypothetical protein
MFSFSLHLADPLKLLFIPADLDNLISGGLKKSNTIWLDPHVSAMVREVTTFCFASDARTRVERIEHLSELPTLWPVPIVRTAFVLDLSDPERMRNMLHRASTFKPKAKAQSRLSLKQVRQK